MLTENDIIVYLWLWRNQERPTERELGDTLGLGRMAMSRAISRLEDIGAITVDRGGGMRQPAKMESVKMVMQPQALRDALIADSPLAVLLEETE